MKPTALPAIEDERVELTEQPAGSPIEFVNQSAVERVDKLEAEIRSVIYDGIIPPQFRIQCREGSGEENLIGSLGLSVNALEMNRRRLELRDNELRAEIRELRGRLKAAEDEAAGWKKRAAQHVATWSKAIRSVGDGPFLLHRDRARKR